LNMDTLSDVNSLAQKKQSSQQQSQSK